LSGKILIGLNLHLETSSYQGQNNSITANENFKITSKLKLQKHVFVKIFVFKRNTGARLGAAVSSYVFAY